MTRNIGQYITYIHIQRRQKRIYQLKNYLGGKTILPTLITTCTVAVM